MKHCLAIATCLVMTLFPPAHAEPPLPECTIQAVVGDWTQVDIVWADNQSVTEYAFATQYMAAQKIADIETEFACDVRWERA